MRYGTENALLKLVAPSAVLCQEILLLYIELCFYMKSSASSLSPDGNSKLRVMMIPGATRGSRQRPLGTKSGIFKTFGFFYSFCLLVNTFLRTITIWCTCKYENVG